MSWNSSKGFDLQKDGESEFPSLLEVTKKKNKQTGSKKRKRVNISIMKTMSIYMKLSKSHHITERFNKIGESMLHQRHTTISCHVLSILSIFEKLSFFFK